MNFWIFMSIGGFALAIVWAWAALQYLEDEDYEPGSRLSRASMVAFAVAFAMLGHGLFVEGKPAPAPQQVEVNRL